MVSFFPLCVFLLSLPFWDGLSSGVRGRRKGGGTMRWSRWERARAGLLASIVALQVRDRKLVAVTEAIPTRAATTTAAVTAAAVTIATSPVITSEATKPKSVQTRK